VLVRNGQIDQKALARESLTREELLEVIHRQGFENLHQVRRCELEPNGTFYVEAFDPTSRRQAPRRIAGAAGCAQPRGGCAAKMQTAKRVMKFEVGRDQPNQLDRHIQLTLAPKPFGCPCRCLLAFGQRQTSSIPERKRATDRSHMQLQFPLRP
jgi:hypothetical protein